MKQVEQDRRERRGRPQRGRVAAAADPGRGHLERLRPPVRLQRDRLPVQHHGGHRQRERGLTTSGTRAVMSSSDRV